MSPWDVLGWMLVVAAGVVFIVVLAAVVIAFLDSAQKRKLTRMEAERRARAAGPVVSERPDLN
jgi:uncharacterized protein (DUF58 family)